MRKFIIIFMLIAFSKNYTFGITETYYKAKQGEIGHTKNSKQKLNLLVELFYELEFSDTLKARKVVDKIYQLGKKTNNKLYTYQAHNFRGFLYEDRGDLLKAKKHYGHALDIGIKINNSEMISKSYNNLGIVEKTSGNFTEALRYYQKCLKIELSLKDSNSIAGTYVNIGEIYREQHNYKKALSYFTKAKNIWSKTNMILEQAIVINNRALVFQSLKQLPKARNEFRQSILLYKKINNKDGIASSMMNLGLTFYDKNYPDSCLYYNQNALKYATEVGDSLVIMNIYSALGQSYYFLEKYKEALKYLEPSYNFFKQNDLKNDLENVSRLIALSQYKIGNHKLAFSFLNEHLKLRSEILDIEKNKQLVEMDSRFESVQKDKQIASNKAEITIKKNQQNALFLGLGIVLLATTLLYNRFRITKKQKMIIEQQKYIVVEKNKEITDSITYAKRIQSAILPKEKTIKSYFPDSLIFYKPKDIVAGDFYWFEVIDDLIFFAAADCTGHGVPGAMVSVVCNNALNRSVKEFNLKMPNLILDKTREIVISEFEKSDEDVKDGMDISLCVFNLNENKLFWSGAHNPLWILRNQEIIEYKADKQPIGKFAHAKEFSLHEIEIQKNDEFYFFTDGFQDQFGGEKGKKFKVSQIREILITSGEQTIMEKEKILQFAFENWKGALEQVDDVCVIGIRL